jgi:hypothetical protein
LDRSSIGSGSGERRTHPLPFPRATLVEKPIELTNGRGKPLYVNPDHIVTIGSEMGDLDRPAIVTLSIQSVFGSEGVMVRQSVREVLEKIGPATGGPAAAAGAR